MAVPTEEDEDEAEAELCAGPNHNEIIHKTVRVLQSRMFLNHKVVQLMCLTCLHNTFFTTITYAISIKLHVGLVGGRFRHSKGVVPFSTMLTKCILGINTNKHVLYGVGCSSSLGARRWSVHSFFRSKGEFASNPVCRPQVFFCPIT